MAVAPHATLPPQHTPPHEQARFHALMLKVVGSWRVRGVSRREDKAGCFRAMNGDGEEEWGPLAHLRGPARRTGNRATKKQASDRSKQSDASDVCVLRAC